MTDGALIAGILNGLELRAAALIVTVYGDVVVPRGGVLWTGTLIDICGRVGINESLVRTAVSRLVAAKRLRGERVGRRSFYRLDASAEREFRQAAALLYAPEVPARGWQILYATSLSEDEARHLRMGHMGNSVYIRPDRGQEPPEGALVFHAANPASLSEVARFWDLSALDRRYFDMLARFRPLAEATERYVLSDEASLVARLLLVHEYRNAMLRDPRLPQAALLPGWKGYAARDLFRTLYLRLSPAAERWTGTHFEGIDGCLPARTELSQARLEGLA